MSTDAKKLAKGEVRFVVKKIDSLYRVYDRHGGSFPYRTGELGVVKQDVSLADAEAEAERLNEKFVGAAPPAPRSKTVQTNTSAGDLPPSTVGRKPRAKKDAGPPPDAEVPLFKEAEFVPDAAEQLPDYGDLEDKTDAYVDWK